MKKYRINYYFDGEGEVSVKANSKKEAEKKFYEGDTELKTEKEWGENYEINNICKEPIL